MLQKLLSDRFGLRMHNDKRELSVYTLTVAKSGAKPEKSQSDPDALSDQSGQHEDIGPERELQIPEFRAE